MKNMRLILTSLLCLLFVIAGMAQDVAKASVATTAKEAHTSSDFAHPEPESDNENKDQKVITGAKISLGKSRAVVNRAAGEFSNEFSWEAGIYSRYNINRKLYFQPEVIYHQHKYSRAIDVSNFVYTHNQLRGQLLGGVDLLDLGIYFNAGLYYAHQIGGKVETNDGSNTTEETFSDFPERNGQTDPFNTTDFGYILGGTISCNGGGFAMSVLFSRSFDSVLNDGYHVGDAAFENLSLRHRSVHFVIQKKF